MKEGLSFNNLLSSWKEIVEDCDIGYNSNIYELDYDLNVRNMIQLRLETDKASNLKTFAEEITLIDEKFLRHVYFVSDKDLEKPFWQRKLLLKKAGQEYIDSVRSQYDNIYVITLVKQV